MSARPRMQAPAAAAQRREAGRGSDGLFGVWTVLAFLVVWQAVVQFGLVNPLFLSSPSLIAGKFVEVLRQGRLARDVTVSGSEFLIGYLAAVVVGIPLGIGMGWYRRMSAALRPFVAGLYSTPKIALIPLLIIWFGIGIWSKVAVVFLGCIFQIVVNTDAGVRAVDDGLIRAARAFGASDRQIFGSIVLPGSVPFLLSGLRLAIGQGLVGVVVGELYASTAGVGYELMRAGETFQTSLAFVYIILLVIAGIILTWLLRLVEDRFEAWRPVRLG